MMSLKPCDAALLVVNQLSAMVAYWDRHEKCVFSNDAYRDWFGVSPEQMRGMALKDLLGPLYQFNLPYIKAALRGETQVFERRIPLPDGGFRDSIATYTPDIEAGIVRGFSVLVTDVTILREREAELKQALLERDHAHQEVLTLRKMLPICAWCKSIHNERNEWQTTEQYIAENSLASMSHGICPACFAELADAATTR